MEYKVYIFSDNALKSQIFNFTAFRKFCARCHVNLQSIHLEKFDSNWKIDENTDLIIFCENNVLDSLIINNIDRLGNKKTFIKEQIVIFEKNGHRIVFAPIEADLALLEGAFPPLDGKKYCQFHLFGISEQTVLEKLGSLKSQIDGFQYSINYHNLLCDVYICYNGQSDFIDDNQVTIASQFKQYIYSENDMNLTNIIGKMLSLKNYTLAINEDITKGEIAFRLLQDNNDEFIQLLKSSSVVKPEYCDSDQLYNKAVALLKSSGADIAVVTSGQQTENGVNFNYAIAQSSEVHLFKNNFKADFGSCIKMAENSLLYHLAKKLRQNDISF